jgi:exonuclease SbcC
LGGLFEQARAAAATHAEETATLRGANQALGPQTEPIKVRLALLRSAPDPVCPTCGQPLDNEERKRLVDELAVEVEARREEFRRQQGRIRELEEQSAALDRESKDLERRLSARPALEKRRGEVEAALAHAEDAAGLAARIAERVERRRVDLEGWARERGQLEAEAQTWESRLAAASLTQENLERIRLEKRLADERVGGARQQLAALESAARQREDVQVERARREVDLAIDQDLRQAFSKRGVPAWIIETAVPELERAANEILTGLTENRLHVRFETQREIRTGEMREALDIVISDDLGSRPYELYSGGEAFRIDFAIRIALSRLLARRAGAHLRSLFIDEGFGTQDARGREQLISAIHRVQDDFDRILVITHIEEMKDSFPVRIEVEKTPQGSQFHFA